MRGLRRSVVSPISKRSRRREIAAMKLPSHPKALALLAAIFPVMDRRTRRSAAWIMISALSATFWLGLVLVVVLLWRFV